MDQNFPIISIKSDGYIPDSEPSPNPEPPVEKEWVVGGRGQPSEIAERFESINLLTLKFWKNRYKNKD